MQRSCSNPRAFWPVWDSREIAFDEFGEADRQIVHAQSCWIELIECEVAGVACNLPPRRYQAQQPLLLAQIRDEPRTTSGSLWLTSS